MESPEHLTEERLEHFHQLPTFSTNTPITRQGVGLQGLPNLSNITPYSLSKTPFRDSTSASNIANYNDSLEDELRPNGTSSPIHSEDEPYTDLNIVNPFPPNTYTLEEITRRSIKTQEGNKGDTLPAPIPPTNYSHTWHPSHNTLQTQQRLCRSLSDIPHLGNQETGQRPRPSTTLPQTNNSHGPITLPSAPSRQEPNSRPELIESTVALTHDSTESQEFPYTPTTQATETVLRTIPVQQNQRNSSANNTLDTSLDEYTVVSTPTNSYNPPPASSSTQLNTICLPATPTLTMAQTQYGGAFLGPAKFNNTDNLQSAKTFISKYDVYKQLQGWDDLQAAQCFDLFLGEEASVWLGTIPEEAKTHYPTLKELFLKAFSSEGSFLSTYHLMSRMMRPGETMKSYLTDVYKLFSSSTFSEEHRIMLFIKGLRDDLHDFVIGAKPKTLLEAIESAKLKESLLAGKPVIKNTGSASEMTTLNALSQLQDAENSEFSAKLNEMMTKLTNMEARDKLKDKTDEEINDNQGKRMNSSLNEIIKRVTAMEQKERQTPWRESSAQQQAWNTNSTRTYNNRRGFSRGSYPSYNRSYSGNFNNQRRDPQGRPGNYNRRFNSQRNNYRGNGFRFSENRHNQFRNEERNHSQPVNNPTTQGPPRSRQNQPPDQNRNNETICNFCNKVGHLVQDCFQRLREERRERTQNLPIQTSPNNTRVTFDPNIGHLQYIRKVNNTGRQLLHIIKSERPSEVFLTGNSITVPIHKRGNG